MKPYIVEKNHRLLKNELEDRKPIAAFNPIHTEEGWACDVYYFDEPDGDYSLRKRHLLRAYLSEEQDWSVDDHRLENLIERIENESEKYIN